MRLTRIVEHLRQLNWTAVVIELLIVVVGVFIGMQVSNWNAAQAEQRIGHAYTARLTEDLKKDLVAHRQVIAYYTAVRDSVERTNAMLADPRAEPKALVAHAYRGSEIAVAMATHATWDEIVSSGDTGLLPRAAVESGIADYFASDTMRYVYELLLQSDYRRRARSLIPLEVQKAIRAGCSDIVSGSTSIIGFVPECTLDLDDRTLGAAAAALRADPQFAADLRFQYSMVTSTIAVLVNDVRNLEAALSALGVPPAQVPGAAP